MLGFRKFVERFQLSYVIRSESQPFDFFQLSSLLVWTWDHLSAPPAKLRYNS